MENSPTKNDKDSKTEIKKTERSDKNNTHAVVITSPRKRKLQKEEKDTSTLDRSLDIDSNKHDNISKKLESEYAPKRKNIEKQSPKTKKAKTVDLDLFEGREEKKKQRAISYEKYLQRGGARNPGSKEIPNVRVYIYM